jgi:phage shock protein PspC (stress-responsive transcriptional regulator)
MSEHDTESDPGDSRDAGDSTTGPAAAVDSPFPPPPPPPPPPRRSLSVVRARSDRKLGGVAAGLATAAGLDPTLVRIGLAVGALTGWAILLYLIAWVILPEEDVAAGRRLEPAPEDTAKLLRIGVAVIAGLGALQVAGIVAAFAIAVLGTIGAMFHPFIDPFAGDFGGYNPDFPVRGFAGLLLLAGGGFYLLRRRSRGNARPSGRSGFGPGGGFSSGGGTPPPPRGGTPPPPGSGGGVPRPPGSGPLPAVPVPPGAPGAGVAGTGRNWRTASEWLLLGTRAAGWLLALWFTFGFALLTALWALDAVQLRFPFLLVLVTLGALGLLGTVLVRSRRPAMVAAASAALLVPVVVALLLGKWNGVAGYRVVTPTSTAEVPAVYRHAFGELRLDLSQLALPPGTTEIKIEMGAGETSVTVPWDATVEAAARVGAGEFNLFGRSQTGLSLEGGVRSPGEPGAPTLKIVGRVSAGQIKLFRRSPPATMVALQAGQAVRLACSAEREGLRCLAVDGYATPALDCLVSSELESMCRPAGETLDEHKFPGDRTGLRRCSVPPGGGLAACSEPIPYPPAEPAAPEAPATPEEPAAPDSTATTATSMPPGTYICDFPSGGGPANCRPA